MQNCSIRLRPDQAKFIAQVTQERATDLSAFVRLCVDFSAVAVAQSIPLRLDKLVAGENPKPAGLVSLRQLKAERRKARAK